MYIIEHCYSEITSLSDITLDQHRMVFCPMLPILLCCCLRELYGSSWTKTLQYLVCQIEGFLICSKVISSDRNTLEFLAASVCFNEFFPHFGFACLKHFVYLWNCPIGIYYENWNFHRLCETLFSPSSRWMSHALSPCVNCHTFPSISHWNFPT